MAAFAPFFVLFAFLAAVFQIYLKDPVWLFYGIGRELEPLENYPYTCRKIDHEPFDGCEDMWLSESTRQLYLSCSDARARHYWMPSMDALNITGRSQKDAMIVVDIDSPKGDSFKWRKLNTVGYDGTAGDGLLQLNGFDVREDADGGAHIYVVNNRPSVDSATGGILEKQSAGHNGTIDHFYLADSRSGVDLKHVKTYASDFIATPNRPAIVGDSGFYVTNDHGLTRIGLRNTISFATSGGTVSYCSPETGCKTAATHLNYPNGLVRDPHSGLIYVPSATHGYVRIFEPQSDKSLKIVHQVQTNYGIDNLSIDANGDLIAAAFPQAGGVLTINSKPDGGGHSPPVLVLRIYKKDGEWAADQMLQSTNSDVLPSATTAIHDVKTGRIFLSGVVSPYITVCERNKV